MAGAPQDCHLFSRVGLVGLSGSFPSPTDVYLLLPVGCKMTMFLMTGSGLQTFCQSMGVSCQQATVPLAWTHSALQEEQAASFFVWIYFLLSSRYYSFICTLKTNAVGQNPFVPVWSVAVELLVSHNTVPRDHERVCLFQSEPPGLLSAVTAHCRTPKTLILYHLHCHCVLIIPRGNISPEMIILGRL